MTSLKAKTVNGLLWSFIDRFASQGVAFIVGIVLARILSPEEFGLIGMLTIFIGVSTVFINSGFNQALIRKNSCTEKDYATVFYFNLGVSIVFYLILYFTASLISEFYDEPILQDLIKVLGLVLVVNALTIIQQTILAKRINFKLLTKISLISSIISGIIGIAFASNGFGVWSLVYKQLSQALIISVLLWVWNGWIPKARFSRSSLKELWKFSSNIVALGIIDMIFKNLYNVIIGKFYPVANLGQYTRADQFKKLPSETLGGIIDRVSYPVLSSIKDDKEQFSSVFNRLLKSTMLLSFILLAGLAAVAKELTEVLVGEEWALAGEYLQILAFAAMFYPLDKLLSSILKVEGRSDLILKLGLIRKLFIIPVIFIAIYIGIKPMIYAMILQQVASVILVSGYASKYVGLSTYSLFKSITPAFLNSMIMFAFLTIFEYSIKIDGVRLLVLKIISGGIFIIGWLEIIKSRDYLYLKKEILHKIKFIR